MAIKIFCNQCQNFIKDVEANQIAKLTGEEICEDCKDKNKKMFSDVEKIRGEAIDRIKKVAGEYLVKLDEAIRKVAK